MVQKEVHSVGPYELYILISGYVFFKILTCSVEILSPPVKICFIFSNTLI